MKNKISFISNLLDSKKIDTFQKERILLLTKKELDSIGNSNEIINFKITELEKKMDAIQSTSINSISEAKIYSKIDDYLLKKNKIEEVYGEFDGFQNIVIQADEAVTQQHSDAEEAMINAAIEKQDAEEEMMEQHIDADDAIIQKLINSQGAYGNIKALTQIPKKYISIKTIIKQHKPKDVADFMYLFNKREGFKYLTHDYDEDNIFDIEAYIVKAKDLFKRETKILKIPTDLWQIVNQFAFTKNPDWGDKIKEGFSTQNWIEWSKQNKLSPIRNKEYELIINKFRDLTRVESPNLKTTIEELINEIFKNSNFEINLSRLDKADFYTNTITFKSAIKSIFEIIHKKRNKDKEINKLNIAYKGLLVDNYYEVNIIITHLDSFPSKDFEQLHPEWKSDKGSIGNIKKKLFGYCDWSIESKFENGCYRINLLQENSLPDYEAIPIETVEGTKHILKFYYKTSD